MYCNIKILYLKKNIMISHPVYNHLNIKYKKYTHIYTTYKSQYSLYIAFHSAIACLIEVVLVIPGFSFWICVDTILI